MSSAASTRRGWRSGLTYVYDLVTGMWTSGADMPTVREHLTAAAWGQHIYVIGGRAGASTPANERYHPATNTWQVMAPMPTARAAGSDCRV
jgi:N-acetylneuraminic acid mutarotase